MGNGIPVTPEVQSKMTELRALVGSGKVDAWGEQFLTDVVVPDRKFLTPGQINTIEKMYDRVCIGKKRENSTCIPKTERLKACKQSSGWQIYIDQRAVGISMTKIDAEKILIWFEHSLESLEIVLNKKEK